MEVERGAHDDDGNGGAWGLGELVLQLAMVHELRAVLKGWGLGLRRLRQLEQAPW